MARVKFLVDTVHPDYGYVSKGEVLKVERAYLDEYERLGIAEDTDEEHTSRQDKVQHEKPRGWGRHALPESGEAAGGGVEA